MRMITLRMSNHGITTTTTTITSSWFGRHWLSKRNSIMSRCLNVMYENDTLTFPYQLMSSWSSTHFFWLFFVSIWICGGLFSKRSYIVLTTHEEALGWFGEGRAAPVSNYARAAYVFAHQWVMANLSGPWIHQALVSFQLWPKSVSNTFDKELMASSSSTFTTA